MLRDSSLPEGLALAEELRVSLAGQQLVFDARPLQLTSSFGVACASLGDMDIDKLMSAADEALYKAKTTGRNKVVVSTKSPAQRVADFRDTTQSHSQSLI